MNLLKKCVFENHNQLFDDSMVHIGQNESISKQDFFFFKEKAPHGHNAQLPGAPGDHLK